VNKGGRTDKSASKAANTTTRGNGKWQWQKVNKSLQIFAWIEGLREEGGSRGLRGFRGESDRRAGAAGNRGRELEPKNC